jgi:hypothetical protein
MLSLRTVTPDTLELLKALMSALGADNASEMSKKKITLA